MLKKIFLICLLFATPVFAESWLFSQYFVTVDTESWTTDVYIRNNSETPVQWKKDIGCKIGPAVYETVKPGEILYLKDVFQYTCLEEGVYLFSKNTMGLTGIDIQTFLRFNDEKTKSSFTVPTLLKPVHKVVDTHAYGLIHDGEYETTFTIFNVLDSEYSLTIVYYDRTKTFVLGKETVAVPATGFTQYKPSFNFDQAIAILKPGCIGFNDGPCGPDGLFFGFATVGLSDASSLRVVLFE